MREKIERSMKVIVLVFAPFICFAKILPEYLPGAKWRKEQFPLTYSISGEFQDWQEKMVDDTIKMWEQVKCSMVTFAKVKEGNSLIKILFTDISDGMGGGWAGPLVGRSCTIKYDIAGSINVNSKYTAKIVIPHEIGHCLNFHHNRDPSSIMCRPPISGFKTTLGPNDIETVCHWYPCPTDDCTNWCNGDQDCENNGKCENGICKNQEPEPSPPKDATAEPNNDPSSYVMTGGCCSFYPPSNYKIALILLLFFAYLFFNLKRQSH
jgi:hypothetical protein